MPARVDFCSASGYFDGQMAPDMKLQREIVDVGSRLWQRGMVAGSDGNISARSGDNRIFITPAGEAKGSLETSQLITVDLDGRQIAGKGRPSSEMPMHLTIYKQRSEIAACVHSHAPHATAFAAVGIEPARHVSPEVVLFVGRIPLVPFAFPGTEAVAESLAPFIDEHVAFLLQNHGLLTIGRTLEEAYRRHEVVEHYAQILIAASQIGSVKEIPQEDVARLENLRRQMDEQFSGE